jgi:hypothetical protein
MSLTYARLHALANRISGLDVGAHAQVMQFLEASGSPFTRNNNGVFVDLCSLDPSLIAGLTDIAERAELEEEAAVAMALDADAAATAAAAPGEEARAQVPWVGTVEARTVMDRADEVLRKHMRGAPSRAVASVFDTATKRRNGVQRKTFVNTNRRSDIYDACLNTLAADA